MLTTIYTRIVLMLSALMLISGIFMVGVWWNESSIVQTAAKQGASVGSITSNVSAIQKAVQLEIDNNIPTQMGSTVLFNPSSDVIVNPTYGANGQETQVVVKYSIPLFGPIANFLGISPTMTISKDSISTNDYKHNGLHAQLLSEPNPMIGVSDVQISAAGGNVSMKISGFGFGNPPAGVPGTTTGTFFLFTDSTAGWSAGSSLSGLAITYSGWSDSEIDISGIQNYGKGTEVINAGDRSTVTVISSNGPTTYQFVANPSGTTDYTASLSATTQTPNIQQQVTLTALTSVQGNGTNGIGIYDATDNKYLAWSGSGEQSTTMVSYGASSTHSYQAYYGPKNNVGSALAKSKLLGVTWQTINSSSPITALVYPNSTNTAGILYVFGTNLTGATISGTGISGVTPISDNELQATSSSTNSASGVIHYADGTSVPFTAQFE